MELNGQVILIAHSDACMHTKEQPLFSSNSALSTCDFCAIENKYVNKRLDCAQYIGVQMCKDDEAPS